MVCPITQGDHNNCNFILYSIIPSRRFKTVSDPLNSLTHLYVIFKMLRRTLSMLVLQQHRLIMVAQCNRADHIYFHPVSSSFFFFISSPNLSGQRLDVYHTSAHGVDLVRIQNAGLKCAARGSLKIQDAKMTQKIAIWAPSHKFVVIYLCN